MPGEVGQETPKRIGPWLIEEKIGEGGMGSVYRGRHESTKLPVAVKLLPKQLAMKDNRFRERFFREASIAARMQHPNMVHVHDSGEEGIYYYLVMDYVEGETCRDTVQKNGRMGWERGVDIILQVATGLEYAAVRGIIHRDVSPGNIIIESDGTARIADLGLAKEDAAELAALTVTGSSLGTPYYMSPEQINDARNVDFRSDIYSLGATLYHLVCGTVPYTGTTFEVMTKQVSKPLPDPREHVPDLAEDVCCVLRKMMAKSRDDRYQSYEALRDDLNALLRGKAVSAQGFRDRSMVAMSEEEARRLRDDVEGRAQQKTLLIENQRRKPGKLPLAAAIIILIVLALVAARLFL